nr:hypothetical 1.5K protein - Chinese hamster [Cricetulus griseus]
MMKLPARVTVARLL